MSAFATKVEQVQSQQASVTVYTAPTTRRRLAIISVAFWHMLRRDLTIGVIREFGPMIAHTVGQPFFLLLVFGRILPMVGATQALYPALFYPGVVALNVFLTGVQSITVAMVIDFGTTREIDDRLLAPAPTSVVALEKIFFGAMRALIAGLLTIALALLVVGPGFQMRTDMLLPLLGVLVLIALTSAALGLWIGAALPFDMIWLIFTLVFTVTQFTGCVFFTWRSLDSLRVIQIITLTNPVTFAAESLRATMVAGTATMPLGWAVGGMGACLVGFLFLGLRTFRKRAIS